MEKISEMIKRLCPETCKKRKISEICSITTGKLNANAMENDGKYFFFTCSDEIFRINHYAFDGKALLVSGNGYLGGVKYYDGKFNAYQRTYVLMDFCNIVDIRYIFYYMSTFFREHALKQQKEGSVPYITISAFHNFDIPLPPLSIQQEIVRVLDSFTQLQSNLEAELAARQKQYEYYRNKLLTFDKDDESVEWKTLGEVCNISRGKRVVRKDLKESGTIPVFQNSLKPLGYSEESNYPANTPFVISAGAAGEVGYSFTEYWGADDCFSILCNESVYSRFVYHWLKIKECFLQSRIRGGAIKRLSRDYVDNLLIPTLPPKRQYKIVSILDTFESLITNLKEEIAARKKQYEYYREQLLRF